MMFGAAAAVLRYNLFSRIFEGLIARLFGIPLLCFFDDFGALIPRPLAKRARARSFYRFLPDSRDYFETR